MSSEHAPAKARGVFNFPRKSAGNLILRLRLKRHSQFASIHDMGDFSEKRPNGRENREASSPWITEKLNTFTSLERPGAQHIGKEFEITYFPKGGSESKTVSGIVIDSAQAATTIQDNESGELISINTNWDKIASIKSRSLQETPSRFRDIRPDDMVALLKHGKPVFGRCVLSVVENEKRKDILVSGAFSLEQITDGYEVIKITDSNGVAHMVDPDRVYSDFAVSDRPEDVALLKSSTEHINIVDADRTERVELAQELVTDLNVLDNSKYYEYFSKDPERAKNLLSRWYRRGSGTFNIEHVIQEVESELGAEYLATLADPGIAQHFDAFFAFAKEMKRKKNTLPSPVELRKSFSEHLGTKTIYRGMMLTDEELALVQKSGILSPALTNKDRASHVIQETIDPTERQSMARYARDFYSEIMGRLTDFHDRENSTTISVSAHEPVARSVGYHSSDQLENPEKHMYVFECEVPVISLIKMENVFDYERNPDTKLTIGDFETDEGTDLEVEMFVPYNIPPTAIKKTERVDVAPPKWVRHQK